MGAVIGRRVGITVLGAVLVLVLANMAVQGWLSHRPVPVGLVDGRLRDCPASPNCVSSDAPPGSHFVAPLTQHAGNASPFAGVQAALDAMPRARVITKTENYLHAEFESLLFRFVDDVEFHHRPANGTIAVRSASRMGYWDLGTNRRRIEHLRARLAER
jgi:uncharacterized protein (DUF1499 family)